jgi:uncharacterized protein YjbJ (UPF0337 family)
MDRTHATDDVMIGKWQQLRGQAKIWWNELTDDELDQIDGHRDKLVGKLRERYGWDQMRADDEVERFLSEVG